MLFVSHPPNPWRVKLSDFGISKRKGETEQSTLVRGTPSFMPPESLGFLGDPKKIDHYAADMWCFGETLFRMLCGHATFASHAELARYVNGAHSLPKDNLIKLGVSQEAVDVFLSLLALNPSERLTADGVSRHAWMVNNGFVKTHTKQLGETNEVTIDTNKHSLLGTKGYRDDLTQASGLWTTTTTPSGANAPIQAMTTQPTIEENPGPVISSKEGSSIVVNELPNMSESSPCDFIHKGTGYCASANHSPPENMTRQTIKLEDSITGDPKQANTSTEMRTNVSFLQSHTNGCFMAGELTDLEQVINDTASVVSAFTEKSERDQIKLQMLNAPAAKRYKKTMVTLAKNGYLSNRKVTMTMQTLEKMLLEQNKTREARMIYPDAIDIRRKLFGEEDKVAFKLMELYAESLLRQGQFWKAEMIGNRLLNHGEQNWKDDTVGKIATTDLLAVSLYEQGKEEELENVCRTLIALQEAKWGVDNSRTLGTMKLLADALFMQHKHDLAEQVYRDVLRYRKNIPGKRNLLMAKTMVCLAQTLVLQGKIEETDSLIECALKMKRMLKQRESLDEMHFLGKLLYDQKCYSQAEKVLRATISLKKQHLGPKDPVTLRSMDRLSQVLRREMKYSDAEDLLEETIAIKESSIGPKHPSTMQTKALLEKVRTLHRGLEFGRNESIPLESEALVEGA
jgi:tetratricopeptide (TPR) repeat protein